jgi:hypothetical protein
VKLNWWRSLCRSLSCETVVSFGEVDVDSEEGLFVCSVFVDVVDDSLEGEGCARVGSECVLGRGDNVVGGEMGHELAVDDGVKDFCDDWEE